MAPLRAAAAAALSAWDRAAAADLMRILDDYQQRLREFDRAAGIGIWTAGHQRLADIAAAAGALYKTSGAGGGDFGLALPPRRGHHAPRQYARRRAHSQPC
jgi:phosphomevalonate kinase